MPDTLYQIMGRHRSEPLPERKPSWLKVKAPGGPNYMRLKHLMRELDLHSVCEKHTPNVGECWEHGTATFMSLGASARGTRPTRRGSRSSPKTISRSLIASRGNRGWDCSTRDNLRDRVTAGLRRGYFAETIAGHEGSRVLRRSAGTGFPGTKKASEVPRRVPRLHNHNQRRAAAPYRKRDGRPICPPERDHCTLFPQAHGARHLNKTGLILGLGGRRG